MVLASKKDITNCGHANTLTSVVRHVKTHYRDLTILDRATFFSSHYESQAAIERLRRATYEFSPAEDQPGAVRYKLDTAVVVGLISPWLNNPVFQSTLYRIFGEKKVFIKYIRSRNPLPGQGEQEFHSDWFDGFDTERIEVFVALDDVAADNGPLEVQFDAGTSPASVLWEAGGMVMIDSRLSHRGTANISGRSRQVISAQIGINRRADEKVLVYLARPNWKGSGPIYAV